MAFLFPLAMVAVLFICVAMTVGEGLWSNLLTWINVIVAGLLAMSLYETLAGKLYEMAPTFVYFWEFLSMWLVFIVSLIIFRVAMGFASRVRVRFLPPIEKAGSILFASLIGFTMMSFAMASLHTAPLAQNFMWGGFKAGAGESNLGIGPDRMWVGFAGMLSKGSLATSPPQPMPPADAYVGKNAAKRKQFEAEPGSRTAK